LLDEDETGWSLITLKVINGEAAHVFKILYLCCCFQVVAEIISNSNFLVLQKVYYDFG